MCTKNELPKDLFEYLEPPSNLCFENTKINIFKENNIKKEEENKQNFILYNIGGLSNYEISSIDKANNIAQFNFNLIYGSNNIYNYEEYFDEIKAYLEGNNGIIQENYNEEEININEPESNQIENNFEINEEINVKNEEKKEKKKKKKKRKYTEDINIIDNEKLDESIKIEMKEMKEDKKEVKEKEKGKKEKKSKKEEKKKIIEMDDINNNNLKEPLNSEEEDMK